MKSCLIEIQIGQKVMEIGSGRIGVLKDIKLTPNGRNSPELVATLYVYMDDTDVMVSSTSDNWTVVENENYKEFYPSVHLNHLCDRVLEKCSIG